jgi:uncharacterized membrane protein YheB (UPF0754 family)
MKDMSILTNLAALLVALTGFLLPGNGGEMLLSMGLYALSGAVTNWLAIHMLFEKVPGFYGSGVIPARFTEFKSGIRALVMEQFFNPENVRQFFSQAGAGHGSGSDSLIDGIKEKVDFDKAFDALVDVIMQSSFGSMLGMLGGASALKPLREPFVQRMQQFLDEVGQDKDLLAELGSRSSASLLARVEVIVDKRLDELTPQLVKEIIQQMIRKHLGWLVVWGGVVGGLIGLLVALFL